MREYRVLWQQCPHVHHDRHVMFVEAASEEDAKAIARNHVERHYGVEWFTIWSASETAPVPAGRVKEG
jgi:hypothetical protein